MNRILYYILGGLFLCVSIGALFYWLLSGACNIEPDFSNLWSYYWRSAVLSSISYCVAINVSTNKSSPSTFYHTTLVTGFVVIIAVCIYFYHNEITLGRVIVTSFLALFTIISAIFGEADSKEENENDVRSSRIRDKLPFGCLLHVLIWIILIGQNAGCSCSKSKSVSTTEYKDPYSYLYDENDSIDLAKLFTDSVARIPLDSKFRFAKHKKKIKCYLLAQCINNHIDYSKIVSIHDGKTTYSFFLTNDSIIDLTKPISIEFSNRLKTELIVSDNKLFVNNLLATKLYKGITKGQSISDNDYFITDKRTIYSDDKDTTMLVVIVDRPNIIDNFIKNEHYHKRIKFTHGYTMPLQTNQTITRYSFNHRVCINDFISCQISELQKYMYYHAFNMMTMQKDDFNYLYLHSKTKVGKKIYVENDLMKISVEY